MTDDSWIETGHRLRVTRLALGITEREAAAASGVTVRTYRRWEAGGYPRGTGLRDFAARYDVSMDWLLFGGAATIRPHLAKRAGGKLAILPVRRPEAT